MLSIQPRQTHSMWTRDGVRLDADVYYPDAEGLFPVLLMRQPYGRAIASTIVYAHPQWYAAHGYIVVIQDVRGRGTSEGVFDLFAHEVNDGEDTVRWAAALSGSDGQVGMYGFSYQGMTQLYAAQSQPAALKTVAPAMTGYHLFEDWAYENGAFCFQLGLMWALQLAAETARIELNVSRYQSLLKAARDLPVWDTVPAQPDVLSGVDSFFHDWVSCAATDSYWQVRLPQLQDVDLPMLHVGGWFDPYLRGDVRLYREMARRSQQLHHLWIGPWGHIPWGRKVGSIDFGAAAMSPIDAVQIAWFDAVLKGKERAALRASPSVRLFEMGVNQWRTVDRWPDLACKDVTGKVYALASSGISNIREDSGVLLDLLATECEALDREVRQDVVVHDPWNPVPALGGHSAIPSGSFDRTAIDLRGDVLTYTTQPLAERLRVAGVIEFIGAIASTTPSYDLCAVVSRVTAGKAFNLTQGYCKVEPVQVDTSHLVSLRLHPTCFNLFPGERLRLSLSAACFPAYPINPGTGTSLKEIRLIDAQIITLSVTTGGEQGARLKLPVMMD